MSSPTLPPPPAKDMLTSLEPADVTLFNSLLFYLAV